MTDPSVSDSLEGRVYRQILDMILSGELAAGQKLVQEELAEKLGVSRTPLRSALAKLNGDKFVKLSSRNEARVAKFGDTEIADLFELRAVLEGLVCRILAQKIERKHTIYLRSLMASVETAANENESVSYRDADIEFHTYLSSLMPEQNFGQLLESIYSVMRMSLSQGILRQPSETRREHLEILNALEARDSDRAEQAMITHIRKTIDLLRQRAKGEAKRKLP